MRDDFSKEQLETLEKVINLRFAYLQEVLERLKRGNASKEEEAALQEVLSEGGYRATGPSSNR